MAKTCGTCNLCCKIVAVDSIAKPAGQWCQHAVPGKGCNIYGDHPAACQAFRCGWLENEAWGEEFKPTKCHFVIRLEQGGQRMCIDVDPGYPDAWRRAPYYQTIKQSAEALHHQQGYVVVYVGRRTIAVFPEEDLEIGETAFGDAILVGYDQAPGASRPYARVVEAGGKAREYRGRPFAKLP